MLESVSVTSRETRPVVLREVAKAGVLEVMRSLRIVALTTTLVTGTGLQTIMVTVALRISTIAEHILAVLGVRIPPVPVVTVRISEANPWTNESATAEPTSMEPTTSVKSALCLGRRAGHHCHTEYQCKCQKQSPNLTY